MMKKLLAPLLIVVLVGCETAPPAPPPVKHIPRIFPKPRTPQPAPKPVLEIDRSYSAKGQSSRVKFIIVHYTVSNTPGSLRTLTRDTVSSHYLLTDEPEPVLYSLVDESRQANHAGVSSWKNYTLMNGSSIGIEIVNPGFIEGPNGRVYQRFPQAQIDKLILLLKDIAARHQIPPENILGHADIAPQRKQDPGPMFPWSQLAQHGLVLWPDAGKVLDARAAFSQLVPDARWFQGKLALHGYAVPRTGEFDLQTRTVISVFQMKYRPLNIDGYPDSETAALLEALNPSPVPLVAPAPAPLMTSPFIQAPVAPIAPIAPAPVAPVPVPAPAIPAPVVPAPLVPAPVAPAPVRPPPTPAPPMPAPVVPATVLPAQVTPAPVAPAPVVPAPVSPAPAIPAPVVPVAPPAAPVQETPPATPAPATGTQPTPAPQRP